MAAKHAKRIIQLGQALIRRMVTRISQETIGLQQACRANETIGIPPKGGAGCRAAGTQDALVQAIQLCALLGRLQALYCRGRRIVLQVGLDLLLLCVKHSHVNDQVTNNR